MDSHNTAPIVPGHYNIVTKTTPTFYFIGVTTSKSSINRVFPLWVRELGYPDLVLEGVDCKLHDEPERYRQAVAQIKYDPLSWGALVTTHKIDLLDAARDMFDYLDPYAQLCGEVSCISKSKTLEARPFDRLRAGSGPATTARDPRQGTDGGPDGALEGHAKDPISAGLSLDAMLGKDYFARTAGQVLCFGAGGAAVAIALHLINKQQPGDRPARFIIVNRSPGRLVTLRAMVESLPTDIVFEYICNEDPRRNDETMGRLPDGSIVINGTGMGKDRPGSPITDTGLFPRNGIAWELNYRGELDFMHQARGSSARNVTVEDGWLYFLHGWTQVIAQVLHISLDQPRFERLAAMAEVVR